MKEILFSSFSPVEFIIFVHSLVPLSCISTSVLIFVEIIFRFLVFHRNGFATFMTILRGECGNIKSCSDNYDK